MRLILAAGSNFHGSSLAGIFFEFALSAAHSLTSSSDGFMTVGFTLRFSYSPVGLFSSRFNDQWSAEFQWTFSRSPICFFVLAFQVSATVLGPIIPICPCREGTKTRTNYHDITLPNYVGTFHHPF
jgi:hypothetical protein